MVQLHPQYIVDENDGRKAVVLSVEEWNQILEELEDLDDIRAYDEAKSMSRESLPFDQAVKEIRQGDNT